MEVIKMIARSIVALASLGMLVLFVAPMFSNIINVGNLSGTALCVWAFCVSVRPLHRLICSVMNANAFTKFTLIAVNVCFIAFAVYGAIVTTAMTVAALKAPEPSSTAVVLGAQVKPWGPSTMLRARIDAAKKYLNSNPDSSAVLSGGKGDDEITSEAECMYNVMTDEGIKAERLIMEERSTNTDENLAFSNEIIAKSGLNTDIAVVTDGFHQLRAQLIAKQQGIKGNVGAVCADTSILYLPTFAVREWFALPYQLVR